MTKKQMLAECLKLAPDFKMTFSRPSDVDTVTASCTTPGGPLALAMVLGAHGRASVETQLLKAALGRLRPKAG